MGFHGRVAGCGRRCRFFHAKRVPKRRLPGVLAGKRRL